MLEQSSTQIINALVIGCTPIQDIRLLQNILEAMAAFLELDVQMGWTRTEHAVAFMFERAGGLDALEEIQKHQNYEIYKNAADMITKFFEEDKSKLGT